MWGFEHWLLETMSQTLKVDGYTFTVWSSGIEVENKDGSITFLITNNVKSIYKGKHYIRLGEGPNAQTYSLSEYAPETPKKVKQIYDFLMDNLFRKASDSNPLMTVFHNLQKEHKELLNQVREGYEYQMEDLELQLKELRAKLKEYTEPKPQTDLLGISTIANS